MTSKQEDGAEQLDELLSETRAILGNDDVEAESTLEEIGVDSLNIVELLIAYDQIYPGIENPDEVRFDGFTSMIEIHTQLLQLSREAKS